MCCRSHVYPTFFAGTVNASTQHHCQNKSACCWTSRQHNAWIRQGLTAATSSFISEGQDTIPLCYHVAQLLGCGAPANKPFFQVAPYFRSLLDDANKSLLETLGCGDSVLTLCNPWRFIMLVCVQHYLLHPQQTTEPLLWKGLCRRW